MKCFVICACLQTDIETQVLFREVAEQLGTGWERLATYLGHRSSDLYAIRRENADDVRDQMFCMLVRWQQRFGPFGEAAFNILSSSLKRIERNDIVEFLKRRVTRFVSLSLTNAFTLGSNVPLLPAKLAAILDLKHDSLSKYIEKTYNKHF